MVVVGMTGRTKISVPEGHLIEPNSRYTCCRAVHYCCLILSNRTTHEQKDYKYK